MSKMRALLIGATATGALGVGSLIPVGAANVVDEDLGGVGHVTVNSYGWADLTVNGEPGYLSVYGHLPHQEADVCVGSDEASATCLSSVVPADEVPDPTGLIPGGLPADPTGLIPGGLPADPTGLIPGGLPADPTGLVDGLVPSDPTDLLGGLVPTL